MKKEVRYKYETSSKLDLEPLSKKTTKIHCPSCENEVPVADVSLANTMAKCQECNVVFSVEEEMKSVQSLVDNKQKEGNKDEVMRPAGVDVYDFRGGLDISFDQRPGMIESVFFMLSPLLILGIVIVLEKGLAIEYSLVFGLLISFVLYRGTNYYTGKYRTNISVEENYLTVSHRPKNLKKDFSVNANDIDQLYLKYDDTLGLCVYMILNDLDGQKHQRLANFNNLTKAKYVEQEIERYLNIKDRKVLESNIDRMHNKNHLS